VEHCQILNHLFHCIRVEFDAGCSMGCIGDSLRCRPVTVNSHQIHRCSRVKRMSAGAIEHLGGMHWRVFHDHDSRTPRDC